MPKFNDHPYLQERRNHRHKNHKAINTMDDLRREMAYAVFCADFNTPPVNLTPIFATTRVGTVQREDRILQARQDRAIGMHLKREAVARDYAKLINEHVKDFRNYDNEFSYLGVTHE